MRARGKIECFEIIVFIFSKLLRNGNLQFRNDFKRAELLSKISFFLYFTDCSKMEKERKETSKVYVQE